METRIEGKIGIRNLNIENSGTDGIKLTIEIPEEKDVSILVNKFELVEALKLTRSSFLISQPLKASRKTRFI